MLFPGDTSTFTAIASDGANESEHSDEATASCWTRKQATRGMRSDKTHHLGRK